MSLETSLELNNQLLTQHNALLERLITALASGVALRPDTVAQVQEYRETVPETKAENTVIRKVTLDDLEFSDIIAWLHSTRRAGAQRNDGPARC
jgi:hypothetical protein